MTMEYTGPPNEWLEKVIADLKLHLAELSYSESTILRLDATWKELITYCNVHEATEFTVDLEREFVWERYGADLGYRDTSHNVSRAIHMLDDYLQYGMVFKQSSITLKGFSPVYKDLFEGFLNHLRQNQVSENSIRTWRSRLFRFEYFLLQSGIERFNQLKLHHVNAYIESLAGFSPGVVGATVNTLRRLFDYALAEGYHYTTYSSSLPCIRRTKKYRLPTVFSPDEVNRILLQVDRSNPLGKRDYAILLLVAKLGLRISDVRQLRFENIDWNNKRISILQQNADDQADKYCQLHHCLQKKAAVPRAFHSRFKSSRSASICCTRSSPDFATFSSSMVKSRWAAACSTHALNSSRFMFPFMNREEYFL